jgi:hypothetical protein
MAKAQELRQAITSMAGRQGPILSAYLSVNADIPENQGRTYLVRLRDATKRRTQRPGRWPSSPLRMVCSRSTGYRSTFQSRSGGGIPTWPP